jgi:hypothetical protein
LEDEYIHIYVYIHKYPFQTAWKTNRMESTGDPVRDRENQQKEQEQAKKDAEKESSWGSRRTPAAANDEVIYIYIHIHI